MTTLNRGILGLGLLAGCLPTEEQFMARNIRLTCEWIVACYNDPQIFADVDECIDQVTADMDPVPAECVYAADAAAECLKGLRDLECEPFPPDIPRACLVVYDCPCPDDDVVCDTGA